MKTDFTDLLDTLADSVVPTAKQEERIKALMAKYPDEAMHIHAQRHYYGKPHAGHDLTIYIGNSDEVVISYCDVYGSGETFIGETEWEEVEDE